MQSGSDYKLYLEQLINSSVFNSSESIHFNFIKLHYYANVCQELNNVSEILNLIKDSDYSHEYAEDIVEIYCDVLNENDDALIFLESVRLRIPDYEYYHLKSDIYLSKCNMQLSESNLDLAFERGLSENSYHLSRTFLYLYFGKYEKVIEIVDNAKIKSDDIDILEINKQFARKKLDKKIDESKLNEIISKCGRGYVKNKDSELIDPKVICANIVLSKNMQYKSHIQNNIRHYPGLINRYRKWPIIPNELLGKDTLEVAS